MSCCCRPASAAFLAQRSTPHATPPLGPPYPAAPPKPWQSRATSTCHASVPTTSPHSAYPKQFPMRQQLTHLVPMRTRIAAIGQKPGPSLLALAALRPRAIGLRFANTAGRAWVPSKPASFRARTMATRRKAGRIRVKLRRPRRRQFPRRHPPRHRQPLRYTSHPRPRALRPDRRGPK